MPEFIPAILAHSEQEFTEKIERVRALDLMVQVDVMDGKFVKNTTWAPPARMPEILKGMPFEVHLMIPDPISHIREWCAAGAQGVIFHVEATDDIDAAISAADGDCAIGISCNPDTDVDTLQSLLDRLDYVQIMGVAPGWSGQKFDPRAIDKIRRLKELKPELIITVDGGVKPDNIMDIVEAGADALVIGSALTDARDPAKALALFTDMLT